MRQTRLSIVLSALIVGLFTVIPAGPVFAGNGNGNGNGNGQAQAQKGKSGSAPGQSKATKATKTTKTTKATKSNGGSVGPRQGSATSGSGTSRHPSGKDRNVSPGNSGTQGKSPSDPDGDSDGGADKPGGTGGIDQTDQDGNNGCGNDQDFEDDNNGLCLGLGRDKPARNCPPGLSAADRVARGLGLPNVLARFADCDLEGGEGEDVDETVRPLPPASPPCPPGLLVAGGVAQGRGLEVILTLLERFDCPTPDEIDESGGTGGTGEAGGTDAQAGLRSSVGTVEMVLSDALAAAGSGTSAAGATAGDGAAEAGALGAALPFTGAALRGFLVAGLTLIAGGLLLARRRSSQP